MALIMASKGLGTKHYVPPENIKTLKAACGMQHRDMVFTFTLKESSCPQCMRDSGGRGSNKGRARSRW